jgi:phosphate-selective porin
VAATAQGNENRLAVGGFVHAHFESGGAPDARFTGINNRFVLRRMRTSLSGSFTEKLDFKFDADFGNNGIAPRTGLSGQLTDAYLAWTQFPAASVRLGQFKTPFGFEQLVSDHKTLTVERGLANDRLTLGRRVGVGVFGDVAGKRLSYSAGVFNGAGTNNGANDNQKFLWVGRVVAVAFEGKLAGHAAKFTTGANGFTTIDKGTFIGRRIGTGLDAQFALGAGELQAEWLRNDQHPVTGRPTAADGWALMGKVNVTTQWQGVLRFETFESNTAAPNTTTDIWTFGVNYLLKGDDVKLSLNYLAGRPPAPAPSGGRFLSRLQVVF